MFFVKYGSRYLHDPRVGLILPVTNPDVELNASTDFKFEMEPNHPLYGDVVERDATNLVYVYSDDDLIYRGEVYNISSDMNRKKTVLCQSDLSFFNYSIVRPYSTLAGESDRTAPSTVDGYFEFLVNEHNSQCSPERAFEVGINQGSSLDPNNYIYRADTTYPNVGETIKDKLLSSLGGYLRVRHDGGRNIIDYLSDMPDTSAQVIEFGENLLDYVKEDNSEDVATYVVPLGKTVSDEEAGSSRLRTSLDISGEPDGRIEQGYMKSGDRIYSEAAVKRYGWLGAVVEFNEVEIASNLVSKGLLALKELEHSSTTIEVNAIDLSMADKNADPIRVGDYVRVRSDPHGFDSYMLCTKIGYDLNDPTNDTFTLGTTFDTITGQQNKRINELNATVNHIYEAADEISADAKAAADSAAEASAAADAAVVMRVDSSHGLVFKNSEISTVLTVNIFHAGAKVTTAAQMAEEFGSGAYIEWRYRLVDDADWRTLPSDDPRLSDGGFSLTVSPDDVNVKTVFMCTLQK